MLEDLRRYYDEKKIGAFSFACPHEAECSGGAPNFTRAQESFVGPEYEKGSVPRLLFLSLDSGSADGDPAAKTLEAARGRELARDVTLLPKGKHWYQTHELAVLLLKQFT